MELADRGLRSDADLAHLNLPVERADALGEEFGEAARPDRRFDAVICEGIDRLPQLTYLNARIESKHPAAR
jgi:hypothetical protein